MGTLNMRHIVEVLSECIHACGQCVAEASPSERTCAAACLDTADTCSLLLKMISRESGHWQRLLPLCAGVCRDCEAACSRQAGPAFRTCGRACGQCADACDGRRLPMAA